MCHAEVHDRQHHENKGLQGDNQDMEYRPADLQQSCRYSPCEACTEQGGNQDKIISPAYMLPNSRRPSEGFGQQAHHFHKQVHRNKDPVVEGIERQFPDEAKPFTLIE